VEINDGKGARFGFQPACSVETEFDAKRDQLAIAAMHARAKRRPFFRRRGVSQNNRHAKRCTNQELCTKCRRRLI
jgi:hypothetical protein